jgi:peptidyl-prolyl cis-trans isomerase SurA
MTARAPFRLRPGAPWLALAAALALPASAQLRPPASPAPAQAPAVRPAPTAPAAPATQQPADFIVAVVNSEPVTNNEVRNRLARIEQQLAQQGTPVPPRAELARQVLERLISERAQLQFARETGIRVSDAQVDQAEQNVARQNQIAVPELRRRLAAEGLSLATFREDLRNQLTLQRLRERELESRVSITEQEIDQVLREQQEAAQGAVELNLAQVLVAVPENAPAALVEELRAKAARVQSRARAGEDFAALARQFSDAPGAAASGGAFGLRPADRYPTLFLEATERLAAGGVSEVVRSGAGFHVLKVLEKRKADAVGITQQRARHILLRPAGGLTETVARQRLADYKRRVEAGQADFADLAREHSQDGSARQGGDLGWANPGQFVPEFEDVLDSLKPGQIAEPFVSRFGVHLVQLVERRQASLSPREQREVARNALREKKLDEAYERWAQDVRGRAFVDLREPPQ